MRSGQNTRSMIIAKSAVLFNEQGYSGSSMSDIMDATGLKKGGIYRHFRNKDELALEAFGHAVEVLRNTYRAAVAGKESAEDKLLSVLSVYHNVAEAPPLQGGCPLLNTAIDTDDTHSALNRRAREVMDEWLAFVESILEAGMQTKEFRADLDVREVAIFLTSAFEGNIMMGKLYNDNSYVSRYLNQLKHYLNCCVKQ
ncbi:TetR/AcrR family transcriptional regulator [Paenibacillus sp. MMS18-CY102]|uniref:TetR/AcrR family transcriptional regulator n=1 Tax=Paenibacillus sp. MMS18-CY102 TaxID=2682849 RepID=UPI0013662316|nr:TetR/AcrR family transcriptional regulator [Paenibacillus sp. MMS18-CY102]MWC31224.1 TetR family transcriptional regulator [Paenibacillus sp. MMS18-CY102]